MQPDIRNTYTESSPSASVQASFPEWKYRFILRKLALKRGEKVLVLSPCEEGFVRILSQQVGERGQVHILARDNQDVALLKQQYADLPNVAIHPRGPSLNSISYQALVWLRSEDQITDDNYKALQFGWRLLANCGRVMVVFPQSLGCCTSKELNGVIEQGNELGFVTRLRRCCDEHSMWIGVKYQSKL